MELVRFNAPKYLLVTLYTLNSRDRKMWLKYFTVYGNCPKLYVHDCTPQVCGA